LGRIKIAFYGALAKITGEKSTDIEAVTLKEAINELNSKYGERFKNGVFDERRKLTRFINIYINGKDIRFLNHLDTKLNDEEQVSIIPAVSGG
jgi:molybdopterin synthase sulfur carrier subunit